MSFQQQSNIPIYAGHFIGGTLIGLSPYSSDFLANVVESIFIGSVYYTIRCRFFTYFSRQMIREASCLSTGMIVGQALANYFK